MMLLRLHLTQRFQSFCTVVSSLICITCVLLQMFNKGKLDGISFNYPISTTKERKLCTTCRALVGFVNSLTNYDHNVFGSDLSNHVLNDHKASFSCPVEKGKFSPENLFRTNAIKQI